MPLNNSYQVKEGDRDFLTLAANLGTDYNSLKQANPSIQSLSQGQFISVPNYGLGGAPTPQYSPPQNAGNVPKTNFTSANSFMSGSQVAPTYSNLSPRPSLVNQGVPPSVAAQISSARPPATSLASGSGSFLSGSGAVNTGLPQTISYETQSFQQALANNDFSQIEAFTQGTVVKNGWTPAQMQAAGFERRADGSYVNTYYKGPAGAGAAAPGAPQTNNNWQTNPALQQVTFNKGKRNAFQTNLKWALNAWRRQSGRNRRPGPAPVAQPEIRGGASSTLDLRIGSG
jgi:hypothetical protein